MTPPTHSPTPTPTPTATRRTARFAAILAVAVVVLAAAIGVAAYRTTNTATSTSTSSSTPSAASSPAGNPTQTATEPATTAPASSTSPDPTVATQPPTDIPGTDGPYSSDQMWIRSEAARKLWYTTATGFAKNYTLASKPRDAATWRARLAPYSSAKVNTVLNRRSLAQVPVKAAWDGYLEVVDYKPTQIAITVNYDDGYALVLYIEVLQQPTQLARVVAFDRLDQ